MDNKNLIVNVIENILNQVKNVGIDYSRGEDLIAVTLIGDQARLAIESIEKQIAKKPVWNCNNEVVHCPNCDYDLMGGIETDSESDPEYCWECGQHLDWCD